MLVCGEDVTVDVCSQPCTNNISFCYLKEQI